MNNLVTQLAEALARFDHDGDPAIVVETGYTDIAFELHRILLAGDDTVEANAAPAAHAVLARYCLLQAQFTSLDIEQLRAVLGMVSHHVDLIAERPGVIPREIFALGLDLCTFYRSSGIGAVLDLALRLTERLSGPIVYGTPYDRVLTVVSEQFSDRFRRFGQRGDLVVARDLAERAVQANRLPASEQINRHLPLWGMWWTLWEQGQDVDDLNGAIDAGVSVIDLLPEDDPRQGGLRRNLGHMLHTRFRRGGDANDRDRAIAVLNLALTGPFEAPQDRAGVYAVLGSIFLDDIENPSPEALEKALAALAAGLQDAAPTGPDRPSLTNNYWVAASNLFHLNPSPERMGHLEQAAELALQPEAGVPQAPSQILRELAHAYGRLFFRDGDPRLPDVISQKYLLAIDSARREPPTDLADLLSHAGTAEQLMFMKNNDPARILLSCQHLQEAVDLSPPGHPERGPRLTHYVISRAIALGIDEAEDSILDLGREALTLVSSSEDVARLRVALSDLTSELATRTRSAEMAKEATALLETTLRDAPPQWPGRGALVPRLARSATLRYELDPTDRHCDLMIETAERLLAVQANDDSSTSLMLRLVDLVLARLDRPGGQRYLDAAVRLATATRDGASDIQLPEAAFLRAVALFRRYKFSPEEGHFEQALLQAREAVDLGTGPERTERFGEYLANLQQLLNNAIQTSEHEDLVDEAVAVGLRTVEVNRDRPVALRAALLFLGLARLVRSDQLGEENDLALAIGLLRESLATTVEAPLFEGMTLVRLGSSLLKRVQDRHGTADLDEAVEVLTRAAALDSDETADANMLLSMALRQRFAAQAELTDSEEALNRARQAAGHPEPTSRSGVLSSILLAQTLQQRFDDSGRMADIQEAISLFSSALAQELTPEMRGSTFHDLGGALASRFRHTNRLADIEEAIEAQRQALALVSEDSSSYPAYVSGLSNLLRMRYSRSGRGADINESVRLAARAVYTSGPQSDSLAPRLSVLGSALMSRHQHTSHPQDLDDAVDSLQRSVDLLPQGNPREGVHTLNLMSALTMRFGERRLTQDLDRAIDLGRKAVAVLPERMWIRRTVLSQLSRGLIQRVENGMSDGPADLDEAIAYAQEAVRDTDDRHPDGAGSLIDLANALQVKFVATRQAHWLRSAMDVWQRVASSSSADPGRRMIAAREAAEAAVRAGWLNEGVTHFSQAVTLLSELAWFGWDAETRREHLEAQAGLAADAAACTMRKGDLIGAVELLELGRSVMWNQALELQVDLGEAHRRAPELAAEMESLRAQLDSWSTHAVSTETIDPLLPDLSRPPSRPEDYEARMKLARRWDELLALARQVPGLESFLSASSFDALEEAAADGPVAIVNVSRYGCDALVIDRGSPEPVRRVPLPGLRYDEVVDKSFRFRNVLNRAETAQRSFLAREQDRHAVLDMLEWLWDEVAEPVLSLWPGATGPDLPRLWWCPTGPLAMLPLHAAGYHPRAHLDADLSAAPKRSVIARVVSSYTPTLSALIRARAVPASPEPAVLVVGMPTTPAASPRPTQPDLRWVPQEARIIARHMPGANLMISCTREELTAGQQSSSLPTRRGVLEAMQHSSWVHFACHGRQNLRDPLKSAVSVWDGDITLEDITRLPPLSREVAVLAACQTSTGHSPAADEAIHLAAGMQMAGFRHVIATAWAIVDQTSLTLTDTVYARLEHGGHAPVAGVANALHEAIMRLREVDPTDPLLWGPYLHLGP